MADEEYEDEYEDEEDEEEDSDIDDIDLDDDDDDEEPNVAAKSPKPQSNELARSLGAPLEKPSSAQLTDERLVYDLTDLILAGNEDEIVEALYTWTSTRGTKWAKAVLRDARDRAKAKVIRIHAVAQIMLDDAFAEDE